MARCTNLSCPAYGRDLNDDEIELSSIGVHVCMICWSPVEEAPAGQDQEATAGCETSAPDLEPAQPQSDWPGEPMEDEPPDDTDSSQDEPMDQATAPSTHGLGARIGPTAPSFMTPATADEDEFELLGAQVFPSITVYQDGEQVALCEVRGDSFLIGRVSSQSPVAPDLDLGAYPKGSRISRHHARISQQNGQYVIEDLGSTHHTWLNGKFLEPGTPRALNDGDVLQIAGVVDLVFYYAGDVAGGDADSERDDDEYLDRQNL